MRVLFALLLTLSLAPLAGAAGPPPIQYTVGFEDADRNLIHVEAIIPTGGADQIQLMMPVWTPGSYLVREYARNIEAISATRINPPTELEIRKTEKNRWDISGFQNDPAIRVRYRLYCREMSVRTNWVERDFALLNGASTFITLDEPGPREHRVRFTLPAHWRDSVSALDALPGLDDAYVAESYDVLVDSPSVLGNPHIAEFDCGGAEHLLVTVNDQGLWDHDQAAKDVRKIVETQQAFWGNVPYDRYLFFNVIGESRGGLEHDNSTVMLTSRWTYRDPEAYRKWLGLVSHEFFHTWNVRRLRPRNLVRYDYHRENYVDELWIAEGVTSYYDDLLQVRAGLLAPEEYFDRLSETLRSVQSSPGNSVQSLRASSFDAWIKHYRPDENSVNARVSYYTKGSLVAWVLDSKIRRATDGGKSLDDVMRTMYERFAEDDRGYTLDDFRSIVDAVSGQPLSDWLGNVVDRTGALDVEEAAEYWGLHIGEKPPQDDAAALSSEGDAAEASEDEENPDPPFVGATVREQAGRLIISQVVRGGPADYAGWNVDDEVVALDGFRATEELWEDRLHQFDIGRPLDSLLARRGRLINRSITLEPSREDQWRLAPSEKADEQQIARRYRWLGLPVPPADGNASEPSPR